MPEAGLLFKREPHDATDTNPVAKLDLRCLPSDRTHGSAVTIMWPGALRAMTSRIDAHDAAVDASGNLAAEPFVLTVRQAAAQLQVSENHLYSLVAQGAIPHVRFGKLIRIPRWGLLQYVALASGAPLAGGGDVALSPSSSVHVGRFGAEEE